MRKGIRTEPDWEFIGAECAKGDDGDQAAFFKGFIKECKTWGTHFQIEMQLCFVNEKLTPEERELLGMLSYEKET